MCPWRLYWYFTGFVFLLIVNMLHFPGWNSIFSFLFHGWKFSGFPDFLGTLGPFLWFVQIRWEFFLGGGGDEVWKLVLGSKKKDKYSGKHQFQWLDVPWVNFSETTSENRDRRL
jgi:hypothetical protein